MAVKLLPPKFEKAFKPADIRAIYGPQLDEEVTYRVARAFVSLYNLKEVLLGRDMRLSSPSLRKAFIKGVVEQGANVIDLGLVDTPAVYYASGTYSMYGAMITASHNPPEYNGIKLVKKDAVPLTDETGLNKIKNMIIKNRFPKAERKGIVKKKNIFKEYSRYLHSLVNIKPPRKIKLVIDAGNGMGTVLAPIICHGFPLIVYPLFFRLDGRFPNRRSDPTKEKNMGPVKKKIKKVKPDFGIAFDGDVDRVQFFDETGKQVNSSSIGSLIAKHMLEKNKKGKIVYTMYTSKSFYEAIKKYGGIPVKSKIGHAFIKNKMRQENALFGCEHSAHFYFKGNFFTDSGILALLRILEVYTSELKKGKKFSDLVREFDRYFQTEDILIEVKNKDLVLEKAKKIFEKQHPLRIDTYDGVYVEFPDYWFDLRKSGTEDILKLIVEARDMKTMKAKQKEILALVREVDKIS